MMVWNVVVIIVNRFMWGLVCGVYVVCLMSFVMQIFIVMNILSVVGSFGVVCYFGEFVLKEVIVVNLNMFVDLRKVFIIDCV